MPSRLFSTVKNFSEISNIKKELHVDIEQPFRACFLCLNIAKFR